MADLKGQVALVTGASRGVGRGVAVGLAHAGATVFATGRTIEQAELGAGIHSIACDHTDDRAVEAVFRRMEASAGRLDILVNVAWGGYERMVEDGRFTYIAPFWEQPSWRWDAMMTAGVRAAFVASQHAARLMVPARRGLIVNISLLGGAEVPRQRRLRRREGGDRQDDVGHGARIETARRDGRVALPGPGAHGGGAGGRGAST